jgi:hypothetical protein
MTSELDARYRRPWGFVRRHWNGDYSLGRSYWVNTILAGLVSLISGPLLLRLVSDESTQARSIAYLSLRVVDLGLWIWSLLGTWRSASKHTQAGGRFGAYGRIAVALSAIWVVTQLGLSRHANVEVVQRALGKQPGPTYTIHVAADGKSVVIAGGMNDGLADSLEETLQNAPGVETVVLDSGGGWQHEAEHVAAVIAKRKLATYVENNCYSACTLAFLGGVTRELGPQGTLGFHRARTTGVAGDRDASDKYETRRALQAAGLPRAFVERVVQTSPQRAWLPTGRQLLAAHVITANHEWASAREELTAEYRASVEAHVSDLSVAPGVVDALVACETDANIQWLDSTGCGYRYDPGEETEAEHLKQQEECLRLKGDGDKAAAIEVACWKAHMPNDWAVDQDGFAETFAKDCNPSDPADPLAKRFGQCLAAKYVELLNASACKPFDMSAETLEELHADPPCPDLHKPELEAKFQAAEDECAGAFEAPGPCE